MSRLLSVRRIAPGVPSRLLAGNLVRPLGPGIRWRACGGGSPLLLVGAVHKKGKPKGLIGSYRSISPLSPLSKLAELVQARLVHVLESRGLLSPAQAVFRKCRSTENQVLRVTQAAAEGFQRRGRSVMVLVDFLQAFASTWKTDILYELDVMGLLRCLTAWMRGFLTDLQASVKYRGQW